MTSGASRFRQAGLSLIELMIAIVLGLLLVAGATQIFLSNIQAFRLQDNISSAQESGRLGLEILLADLRRAGMDYSMDPNQPGKHLIAISGADGTAKAGSAPGLLADSDEVTITYKVPSDIGSMSDCEGQVVLAGDVIRNRYFVKKDTNPEIAALFCEGNAAGGGTALIRGVENFQLQYGVVTPAAVSAALTESKSNGFASAEQYVLGTGGTGSEMRIASIRVGLLLRSEVGIQGLQAPAADIAVLDDTISKDDLAAVKINGQFPVHRFFTGMAALRNDAYGMF